jgi:hypothetical protein
MRLGLASITWSAATVRQAPTAHSPVETSKSPLHALASVLSTSPESDALIVLGRLLDTLPIGFHVSDCGGGLFHILYANRAWERWLEPEKLPVAGKALADLFPSAEEAGVLELMHEVCATGQPKHLKGFEFPELGAVERGKGGETSRWDWEIYPLSGATMARGVIQIVKKLLALGFLQIDGPALDPLAFVDSESTYRKERSMVTS